jgi:hypothetical protein
MFLYKTNDIKETILRTCEAGDIYSVKILYRSLIEHFLRFQYIFFRFTQEKTEDIGVEYYTFADFSEGRRWFHAFQSMMRIYKREKEEQGLDTYDIFRELHPEFADYTNEQVRQKADQFQYRNIIEYINRLMPDNGEGPSIILRILPQYSELSSFTHGGPAGEKNLFTLQQNEEKDEELIKIADMCFLLSASVKKLSLLVFYNLILEKDDRVGAAYTKIEQILKQNGF